MPTTVFDKSATLAGTDDGDGNSNLNVRNRIRAVDLGAATGTQVRITVLFGTAEGTETSAIDDMYVGRAAAAGNAYDFNGNQVQVTFSGGSTINGSAAGSAVSDWVTFGGAESYDNTKNLIVSFHVHNGASCNLSFAAISGTDQYFDTGGASTSASTTTTLAGSVLDTSGFISKIEIQAASGFVPYNPWPQAAPVLAQ